MREPPRPPRQFLLARNDLVLAAVQGSVLSAGVVALYLWRLGGGQGETDARTVAFVALLLGQILLLVIERTRPRVIWRGLDDFGRVSVAVLLSALIGVVLAVNLPPLAEVLKLSAISLQEWGLALLVAGLCTLWADPLKLIGRRQAAGSGSAA